MTGYDIIVVLTLNNIAVASTAIKSQDIKASADVAERASATQRDWHEYLAGRKGWTLNISYLLMTAAKIRDLLYVGQTFGITVKDRANTTSVSGTAILKDIGHVETVGNLCQGSMQFLGSGALT